jgi:hypothetical protein
MKNVDWNKMAAISEVIGTIAVVVSLAFVVHSVDQNTDALRNANMNHVYDRLDSLNGDIAADPQLSITYANRVYGLTNMEASEAQFLASMRRELNQWEQYYLWHRDGLLDGDGWNEWDDYYESIFFEAFPKEWWQASRQYYIGEFAAHVDQIYSQ